MTCPCGTPTQDDAYVCQTCLDWLADFTGSIPALEEQLVVTMTRQQSPQLGYSAPSSEIPLPYNPKAGDLLGELYVWAIGLVQKCEAENVRNQSPYPGRPRGNLGSMTDWLLWRIDGLAYSDWTHADYIKTAASLERRVMKAIDPVVSRTYLGRCEQDDCEAGVYLKDGDTLGRCTRADCGATYAPDGMRSKLESALTDELMTAAQIATAMVILEYPRSKDWVTSTIVKWGHNGRVNRPGKKLAEHGRRVVDGKPAPLYLFIEAAALLEKAK